MNVKIELLSNVIAEKVKSRLCDLEIDADQIADTAAIEMIFVKNIEKL